MNIYSSHKGSKVDLEYSEWKADVIFNIHNMFPPFLASAVIETVSSFDMAKMFSKDIDAEQAAEYLVFYYETTKGEA